MMMMMRLLLHVLFNSCSGDVRHARLLLTACDPPFSSVSSPQVNDARSSDLRIEWRGGGLIIFYAIDTCSIDHLMMVMSHAEEKGMKFGLHSLPAADQWTSDPPLD